MKFFGKTLLLLKFFVLLQLPSLANGSRCVELFLTSPFYSETLYDLWLVADLQRAVKRFFIDGILAEVEEAKQVEFLDAVEYALFAFGKNDKLVFGYLRKKVQELDIQEFLERDDLARLERRSNHVLSLLENHRVSSFLDIGAGEGRVTAKVARDINVSPMATFAIDVASYRRSENLTWLTYDNYGRTPLKSGSIDLVTFFMVLHHEQKPKAILKEGYRVLRSGGRLIIRETNSESTEEALFNSVLDRLFYMVFAHNTGVPLPTMNSYRSAKEWIQTVQTTGARLIKAVELEKDNPFSPVYLVFDKPK